MSFIVGLIGIISTVMLAYYFVILAKGDAQ